MVKTMKSLDNVLSPVKTALLSVTDNVGHYRPNDGTKDHIVYAEDSSNNLAGDNIVLGQAIQGTIDLYSKGQNDLFDKVQTALNEAGVAFYLNSVQYDDGELKGFIHFQWVFEVA